MQTIHVRNVLTTATMLTLSCGLMVTGCTESDEHANDANFVESPPSQTEGLGLDNNGVEQVPAEEQMGESTSLEDLPVVDAIKSAETFMQLLPEPTANGENVVVHMKLPPPRNKELESSLIRVLGEAENPLVVFRTDALVELGLIEASPGEGFFSAFLVLNEDELAQRKEAEQHFSEAEIPSETTVVFNGRTPVAITTGIALDIEKFLGGSLTPLGPCPITPKSELARWEESLMITDLDVVQDPDRTHDACDPGAGNPDGVWTFKHMMEEMAIGSGMSTHDFVVDWLSHWLRDYDVNQDTVPARLNMFHQVIGPWADASGIGAELTPDNELKLDGELDLDLAPFRLSAIVNRIDLGGTTKGGGGYGGKVVGTPTDAGELRFVFGVQNLDTCNVQSFSVILEYGVPIEGCEDTQQWAHAWTKLNDPSFAPRFSNTWRAHLADLTEKVVTHGAAPDKGNENAINQVRTNENALNSQWEFREFTLTQEDPKNGVDAPVNGPLRPHTVAMTPDDTKYHPTPNAVIDHFVKNVVLPSVPTGSLTLPKDCQATFSVPGWYNGDPFRGGNSFTASGGGPTDWHANINPGDNRQLCARHEFSLNTCNGCHLADTGTKFFHVDPQFSPALLSGFLTGGSAGILTVPDSQFPSATSWEFRDLDRRFQRLYAVACAECGTSIGVAPGILDLIAELAEVVPIDPIGPIVDFPHPVGPIVDIGIVQEILGLRGEFANPDIASDVEVGNFVRQAEHHVH